MASSYSYGQVCFSLCLLPISLDMKGSHFSLTHCVAMDIPSNLMEQLRIA